MAKYYVAFREIFEYVQKYEIKKIYVICFMANTIINILFFYLF